MSRAYASRIIDAPIEAVWSVVRDFNALPVWNPGVSDSLIEDGLDSDVVGCIRSFHLRDGTPVREKLLMLDDARYAFTYDFQTPCFPVENYIATMRLMPVTRDDRTFVEWEATFDEKPEDKGVFECIVSVDVFAGGLAALADYIARNKVQKPAGAVRWKGGSPNKVWTSAVIPAPVGKVWGVMRDFAGMAAWHDEITRMTMIGGVRSDKVSGVRDFYFGEGRLHEELLHLDDLTRSFSYRITRSELPWINYVSGPRLWPVTATNETFGVWTGDWQASPQDDLTLMPNTEQNVYQKAFASVAALIAHTAQTGG
jgi:uncharacterized protein YndB with AHSA1/START domain